MKTSKEIRDEIEYLIDTHFTNSNLNYNKFLDWFEPENYFQSSRYSLYNFSYFQFSYIFNQLYNLQY